MEWNDKCDAACLERELCTLEAFCSLYGVESKFSYFLARTTSRNARGILNFVRWPTGGTPCVGLGIKADFANSSENSPGVSLSGPHEETKEDDCHEDGHLSKNDCIGSAFNMKGAMQCPNCRKVERGRWLFANGSGCSFPEFSMDDWTPDEETYDFSYSEMPYRVHWCPFSGFTRVRSSFEEVEPPSTTYHDLQGNHAILSEHAAASSAAHSYVAYFGPVPSTNPNSSESVDDLTFNHHLNSLSAHSEIFSSHAFPAIDIQYQSWGHHSPPFSPTSSHINGAEQAPGLPAAMRSVRGESDAIPSRPGSFVHPLLFGPGSGHRAGNAFVSSVVPNHPGNTVLRTYERIHVSHAPPHQHPPTISPGMPTSVVPGIRRFNGPRGLPPVVSAASQSDHSAGFYIFPPPVTSIRNMQEAENPSLNHFQSWDSGWGSFHAASGGSDSSSRSSSFWPRNWS